MFTLTDVVPWGRSFDEYRSMFALSEADLAVTILGCGDGPASFNADATRAGTSVVSCDPIYRCSAGQIRERIAATYDQVLDQATRHIDDFVWKTIRSPEELGQVRMTAMNTFIDDYVTGKADGRYVDAALPSLPFGDASFDLALCSHLLFLYSAQLGQEFHQRAIPELCRVAGEVRIFPLLALGGQRSPYVDSAVAELRDAGHTVSIERVPYEFQRGGNEMMRVIARRDKPPARARRRRA